jgi:ketosteroid isomerase-like protein
MKIKILVLALALAAAVSAFGQSKDKEESAIVGLIKLMTEAQLKYNAGALDKIFTADYIEISPLGEFDPRDKVLGFYKPEANPGEKFKADVEAAEISLRRYGKFAVLITQLNYKIVNDGKALPPRSMRATFVCRKEKDGWKIASAQYTGIRRAAANAPPKTDK